MKAIVFLLYLTTSSLLGQDALKKALTFHASFDSSLNADFSKGDKVAYIKKGKDLIPCIANDDVKVIPGGGKFGGTLHFPKKGNTRPQFKDSGALNYNDKSWSTTVSSWLKLSPDQDLEPGYCDPIQIVGDDGKKGFIFLEWSKDENPRLFRYAIRPLFHIWNPTNIQWADIPANKRPAVEVAGAPFSRDAWTHIVFTISNINDKSAKPSGSLYLNGKLQGRIENWDLSIAWDPAQVALVLGASYIGHLDDLAVFDRALTDTEVEQLFKLEGGIGSLR